MTKYRISVSIDEQNFFWILIDNGRFIRNPTKEDLNGTKIRSYNKTNICSRCREGNMITDKSILYPKNACHEKDKNGKETGKWSCANHWRSDHQIYDPDSTNNIQKSLRDRRTNNLKDHNNILGDNCQKLTCTWRGVDDLNKKLDCYNTPIDHSSDSELGILQTKGYRLNSYKVYRSHIYEYEKWLVDLKNEHLKEFDHLIFYCISKDGKYIERIYIFPKFEIVNMVISIQKNAIYGWYEKYRIKDEEILIKVNEIWNEIINNSAEIAKE